MSKYNVEYVLNLKDRVSSGLKNVQAQTGRIDKGMAGLSKTLGMFGVALAGGAMAGAFIKKAIQDAMAVEEIDKRLIETAKQLASATNEQAQSLINLAGATQARSRFGDEDIKQQQTALLQYGLSIKQITKLTPIIADFAAATDQDMGTATQTFIQGANGMTRGLKRYGLELELTGDKQENVNQIMEQLNGKFGGAAARDIETMAGRTEQMKNSFSDLTETVGTLLTQGEGGGVVGFINDSLIVFDEMTKFLGGSQSRLSSDMAASVRMNVKSVDAQKTANQEYINGVLNQKGGIESYIKLANNGIALQNQYNKSLNEMSSQGKGVENEQFRDIAIQASALGESQAALLDQTKEYVNGLDSVGQNQAFEKIASQMNVATGEVRKFFAEMDKGGTPVAKTLSTVADFEEEITRLKAAQKDVKDSGAFKKLGKEIADNERKIARITGGAKSGGGSSGGSGSTATSSTLTSRSPQTFNINITKLVETINTMKPQLNTTDTQTIKMVSEALAGAVNDVQNTIK